MKELALLQSYIPSSTPEGIAKVNKLDAVLLQVEQIPMPTDHLFHAGMYFRTMVLPAGQFLVSSLLKVATGLFIAGDVLIYSGETVVKEITQPSVLAGSSYRKCAFFARADTHITMVFPTQATTVAEAEEEFTDEHERLLSRLPGAINNIIVTGE